jgi:hypothetical protein
MTDLRKAAEMALEALEGYPLPFQAPIKEALRQALAQPEQEPVAWNGACVLGHCDSPSGCETSNCCRADYTAPPKQEWDPTDEEYENFCSLIQREEAKLKEKNT